MNEPSHTVHLHIRIAPANRQPLLDFLREVIPFYEAPGGIRIRLLEDVSDPCSFIEVVEYATEEDYEADQRRVEQDAEMKAYLERWRALLDGPPVVRQYRGVPAALRD